jgi:ABC-type branched-subunit amino acid transport system ATPase component
MRTYVMEQGRVLLEGRSADLVRDPRVLTAYLGRHAAAH